MAKKFIKKRPAGKRKMAITRRSFLIGISSLLALESCRTIHPTPWLQSRIMRLPYCPAAKDSTSRGKALIINGDIYDFVHMENVIRATKFLVGIGYQEQDIVVLAPPYEALPKEEVEGLRNTAEYSCFSLPQIAGPATTRNVEASIEQLVQAASPELFVYVTGHGGSDQGSSYAQLLWRQNRSEHDTLADKHLAKLLSSGKFRQATVLFDGCEGEGFAKNVGSDKVLAIAKNRFGQESACAYFAEHFFNAPWRESANPDDHGDLTLLAAARYAHQKLLDGGVNTALLSNGGQDLSVKVKQEYSKLPPGTFPVFLPNGLVQEATELEPLWLQLARSFPEQIVIVDNEEAATSALTNPNARFYFLAEGCQPCYRLHPYLREVLAGQETGLYLYVLVSEINEETKKVKPGELSGRVANALGGIKHWPTLLKRIDGKIVEKMEGFRQDTVYTYGNLPDQSIYSFDKKALQRILS